MKLLICLIFFSSMGLGQLANTGQKAANEIAKPPSHRVDPFSVQSLLVATFVKNEPIATGTGFIVEKNKNYYLVTNWHVVSARRPDTGASMDPQGRYPDEIRILQNRKDHLGFWVWKSERLVNEQNEALWIEHSRGRAVDIAFLKLTNLADVQVYPTNLDLRKTSILIMPTSPVSIIGFPFGQSQSAGLPIWKTGTVASDPDIDYADSPEFLVDCTGRPGMSGSPVYARRSSGYVDEDGNTVLGSSANRFMGIYAGDIDERSEIGRVWKASAIVDIYEKLP